jgi:hypothetical protein
VEILTRIVEQQQIILSVSMLMAPIISELERPVMMEQIMDYHDIVMQCVQELFLCHQP